MTMLKRLLGSLHSAVFDTSPDAGLAFFIRHPDGVAWSVADEVLVATVAGQSKSYPLATMTIGQLAGQLVMDGFEVSGLSPEFSGLSASVLIDGSGSTATSNGDRLYAFRDYLRVLLGGYARELRAAKLQIAEAVKQMVITQAEGEWLDLWGALYNSDRKQGQPDQEYQQLIPKEAFRVRVNALAIEKAILDLTGQRVSIEEPWSDMFRLDTSRLSSLNRFYDGEAVGYHIIRPIAYQPVVWDGVVDIIERNKAAGVIVLPPEARHRVWVRDPLAGIVWSQNWMFYAWLVRTANLPYLDNQLKLSDYEIDRNWLVAMTSLYSLISFQALSGNVSYDASRLLSFGPVPYGDNQIISPYHSGLYEPVSAEMYREGKRTWKQAVVWRGDQSWGRPYSWRIYSNAIGFSEPMFSGTTIDGSSTIDSQTGAGWTGEPWQDHDTWQEGHSEDS